MTGNKRDTGLRVKMLEGSFRWSSRVGFPLRYPSLQTRKDSSTQCHRQQAMTTDRTEGWVIPPTWVLMPPKDYKTGIGTNLTQPLRKCLKWCIYYNFKKLIKTKKEKCCGSQTVTERMKGTGAGTSHESQELGCQLDRWGRTDLRLPCFPNLFAGDYMEEIFQDVN